MFIVYGAYRNQDMTEGKGPMVLDKLFTLESDAYEYIDNQAGVMGRRPSHFEKTSWLGMGDWEVKEHVVLESVVEVETHAKQVLRDAALKKLTAEEQEVLGIR